MAKFFNMNSVVYSQFLRLYTSKHTNLLKSYPKLCNKTMLRRLDYIEPNLSESDISTLLNTIILSGAVNVGFSHKFLQIRVATRQCTFISESQKHDNRLYQPRGGVWSVGTYTGTNTFTCIKKYTVKSSLTQSLRKLFRKEDVDFYVDQASLIIKFNLSGNSNSLFKDGEILIRFLGFPLRITTF